MKPGNFISRLKKHGVPVLLVTMIIVITACSTPVSQNIPQDFYMLLDVQDANHATARNINLRIHADGRVDYDIYETNGAMRYDQNDMVIYDRDQIVRHGKFAFSATQMETLCQAIDANGFFELSDSYQMEIGHSYADVLVEANGEQQRVQNIGMEVPQMRALVETVAAMVPDDLNIEYGIGYVPRN